MKIVGKKKHARKRIITSQANKSIDPITQCFIWSKFADRIDYTDNELIEIALEKCPAQKDVQFISLKNTDDLEEGMISNICLKSEKPVSELVYVFYDEEMQQEVMMLASEVKE